MFVRCVANNAVPFHCNCFLESPGIQIYVVSPGARSQEPRLLLRNAGDPLAQGA